MATAIATYQMISSTSGFLGPWIFSWALSWLTILPVVVTCSPLIQKIVTAMTDTPTGATE
ncbi:MAG: DUF2798 domain-containing protein [Hyphomicrobium sp.]|nr:DUF2798 domain-containing protein [Hyphomicrobium sp.]